VIHSDVLDDFTDHVPVRQADLASLVQRLENETGIFPVFDHVEFEDLSDPGLAL